MRSKVIRWAISILLSVSLAVPVFGSAVLAEVSPGFTEVKVNSDAARPADQINPAIDGNRIVWQDNRNGNWNVYMKDLITGLESQVLASGSTQQYPAVSGEKVVWSQAREGDPWSVSNIYMKDFSTGQITKLSESASSQQYPAISGNKVVWQDDRNHNDDIYLYDVAAKTEVQITSNVDRQRFPAISDNKIVWADWRNSTVDVYMYDMSIGSERRVSLDLADQNYPAISGSKIVWEDSRDGSSIYLYDLTTSSEKRISTHSAQYPHSPNISGNIIVWEDSRNGNLDIYMYDISSGVETQVTTDKGDQLNPAVSGNRIVWQDNRNGNWDIYMYDIATGKETQANSNISFLPADQTNPAIDGTRVAWEDNRDGYPHIYVKDLSTGTERRLSSSAATQQYPAISGDKIVWRDSRDDGSVYMYDLSTLSERRIAGTTRQYSPPTNPKIDGNKIVWQDYRDSWNGSIYLYDLSAKSEQRIAGGTWQYSVRQPDISGDNVVWLQDQYYWYWYGTTVRMHNLSTSEESLVSQSYYLANPAISGNVVVWENGYGYAYYAHYGYYWGGNADIYMYDVSTKMETRLTTNEYLQINPAISGNKLVWADRRYLPSYGIFLYDLSTGLDTRLTASESPQAPQDNPDISENRIVWQDYRNSNWDIYMIDLNNKPPTANAGPDQTVNEGATVNLSGSGTDPNGDSLTYSWVQTAGTPVTLTGASIKTPSFVAPQVDADAILTFALTVSDGKGGTGTDSVNITVKNVPSAAPSPGPPPPALPSVALVSAVPGDTAPPSVMILTPGVGWTLTDTIDVIAIASDNIGIDRVEFSIDGVLRSTDTSEPYTYSWNTKADTDGGHTINVVAFDTAGNVSSAVLSVTVANGVPPASPPSPITAGVVVTAGEPALQSHLSYRVAAGAFRSPRTAKRRVRLLRRRGFSAQIVRQKGRLPYLVEVGLYDDIGSAQSLVRRLSRKRLRFARIVEIMR